MPPTRSGSLGPHPTWSWIPPGKVVSFQSVLHFLYCTCTVPSGLVPLNISTCRHAILQGVKQTPSDGLRSLVEHNTVLTLVHTLWAQKMTAFSQEGIEWLTLYCLGVWIFLYICTCRLLKLAELQGPLEGRDAKLHRDGTKLQQFWPLLISQGRPSSHSFGDSCLMKRHQSWQFSHFFF